MSRTNRHIPNWPRTVKNNNEGPYRNRRDPFAVPKVRDRWENGRDKHWPTNPREPYERDMTDKKREIRAPHKDEYDGY